MSDKPFAVVQFNELINGKKAVELVHVSWLSEDETVCAWPPKTMEHKVSKLVKSELAPGRTWETYPVEILIKAKDYQQGQRRLDRSFQETDVMSSESDSQAMEKDQVEVMSASAVAKTLAQQKTLNVKNKKNRSRRSRSVDNVIAEVNVYDDGLLQQTRETASGQEPSESEGIVNYNDLAKYLKDCITVECDRIKRSLLLTLANIYDKILQAVEYRAELPEKTQAWKEVGGNLPFDSLEKFLIFEENLKTKEEKQNTMKAIFQMVAAGHTNYEEDIIAIMTKILKKNVQLEYSGCGKKAKGVGKNLSIKLRRISL